METVREMSKEKDDVSSSNGSGTDRSVPNGPQMHPGFDYANNYQRREYSSTKEYAECLRNWMYQYRFWSAFSTFQSALIASMPPPNFNNFHHLASTGIQSPHQQPTRSQGTRPQSVPNDPGNTPDNLLYKMPRKKNWKIGKARRETLQSKSLVVSKEAEGIQDIHSTSTIHDNETTFRQEQSMLAEGVTELSDGGLAHPQKPSVSTEGSTELSDGGLTHPQKPSVSTEGVTELSDGGLAHPQKPSVSTEGSTELSDGGLTHPQKPSVSTEGVTELSDGGLAHPQKPSVSTEGSTELSDGGLTHPQKPSVSTEGVTELSDGGLAHPQKPSVSTEGSTELSDGGLTHPQKPSVSTEGVTELSDGGLAHPQKPSVSTEGSTELSDGGLTHPQKPSVYLNSEMELSDHDFEIIYTCSDPGITYAENNTHMELSENDPVITYAENNTQMELSENDPDMKLVSFVFGSFDQADKRFSPESRGNQCTINSLCALTYAQLDHLISKENLDNVLIDGDQIYKKVIGCLREKGIFKSFYLNFEEMPNKVTVLGKCITIQKCDVISGVCTRQFSTAGYPSLHESLHVGFSRSSFLLVMIGLICSAVFEKNGIYYFFDSHSHGIDGMSAAEGKSVLVSCPSLDDLVCFMYAFYESMLIDHLSQFEILPVTFSTGNTTLCAKDHPHTNSDEISQILAEYFKDQLMKQKAKQKKVLESEKVKLQKKFRLNKRKEYMRNYKRNQRLDKSQKQKERAMTKKSMIKSRQKSERQEIERSMTKASKRKARQDSERQEIERSMTKASKRKARQDSKRQEIERSMTKASKRKARQDSERQEIERSMTKASKRKARQDSERQEIERCMTKASMQKARQDSERQKLERSMTKASMHKARQDSERQKKERSMTKASMHKARQDSERQKKERAMTKASMRKARLVLERQEKERSQTLTSMRKCRVSKLYREAERLKKRYKRSYKSYKEPEKDKNTRMRHTKRQQSFVKSREKANRTCNRFGNDMERCIEKFRNIISEGPVFVCTCCHQTWFRHSVVLLDKIKPRYTADIIERYSTHYTSVDNCEWICNTCLEHIKKNNVPPLSVINKNSFPVRPKELELHQLEERLVSLRIPFMQIRELPRGGQLSIKGNVVNVPIDIQPVIHSLPRTFDSHCTIPVKLKKKLAYKKCDFTENVRPLKVVSALNWLINHSNIYKESGITVDDNWLSTITNNSEETVRAFIGMDITPDDRPANETSLDDHDDSDRFSEIDETDKIVGNSDTMLDTADPSHDNVYTFAPGEGQTPLSLYQDKDAEYLSFPTIFCGQTRVPNEEREVLVHYSDICKLELRHVDRRVASNVPNIFFKMKKVQLKQVSDKVHLALRRCKHEGKRITASEMLDTSHLSNIVRLDEGYYIFRSLRNSPPYFDARKKDVFAMIRQLGLPTWFTSLSSADTRWQDLLNMLSQLNNGQTLSKEEIDGMSWTEKTKLVQRDPVTCVRYFDHRVQEFINTVLRSHHEPLGKIIDYFYRVEFQKRGSPHIHMLMWIEGAPQYKKHTEQAVTQFIDKYVSCNKDENEPLVELQVHKHSKSCRKGDKAVCRFGFPLPPMRNTTILEPSVDVCKNKHYKVLFEKIQKELDDVKNSHLGFEDFLRLLDIDEEEYLKAIQSSLNSPKVFLKRTVREARVNAYMKPILNGWVGNHDLQFVLDPYACAVYIVSYISKAQRGMSILMHEACKEARQGNMDLRQQVRHIGNKFLNSVEVSAQEACYLLLQLPLTKCTRDVVFINTSKPADRTFLLKSKEALEKLPGDSTDIEADNIIKRYSKRPKALEHWCLADYVSQLEVVYKNCDKQSNDSSHTEDAHKDQSENTETNDDEMETNKITEKDENEMTSNLIPGGKIELKNGVVICKRKRKKIIRYVRFSKKVDTENYYRERLLLFFPWRNEENDLKGGHETYQLRYLSIQKFVENKANEYERNADELDHACEKAQNEDNFDEIAPSNQQAEEDDVEIGAKDSEEFIYFDPDRPDNQRQYDIAGDVGLSVASVDISIRQKTMSDAVFRELVKSLNVKQKEFFVHVLQTVKANKGPLRVFLTGGAGVGKSVVVTALFEALQRYLTSAPGDNPENCKVLLCAPTGKAAFHINGITLHSAFRIPASQGYNCTPLSSDTLNSLRTKYKDLAVVMIDEVSMVGNNMLRLINERLKQIKGSMLPFGGIHMIFIGDLFQLKPVMDGWIFENLKSNFGPLATNLWQEFIEMHELQEIMRQKNDKQFAEILNRLREGNQTKEDIAVLQSRLIRQDDVDYPRNEIHLFNTNESVNAFNFKNFETANTEKCTISALDHVLSDDTPTVKEKLVSRLPSDSTHTAGLSKTVGIAIGMIYDLCVNLDVDDGLVNGSSCVVTKVERRQKNTSRPSIVWVEFNNADTGSAWRSKYQHLYHSTINSSWIPIFDCKRNFVYFRKTFVRVQIPLRQATAKTVHKSQGDTLSKVVVDMTGKRVFPHAHYVAISRSKTLQGLSVINLNESKISVSDKVTSEMSRLRKTRQLKLCYTPAYVVNHSHFVCMLHNICSLRSHLNELFNDLNAKSSDIIGLVETWLRKTDSDESLQQTGFQMFREDGLQTANVRAHRGIVVYVKNGVQVLDKFSVMKKQFEMMVLTVLLFGKETLIATLYRSPTSSIVDFKSFLRQNLLGRSRGKRLVIQGDINVDLLEKNSSFVEFMQETFECVQVVHKPTYSSGSLIDHIYTNMPSVSSDVINCIWSDHDLVYAAFENDM